VIGGSRHSDLTPALRKRVRDASRDRAASGTRNARLAERASMSRTTESK
jgi:hypothetical protein